MQNQNTDKRTEFINRLKTIDSLVNMGRIDSETGMNLKNQVLKSVFQKSLQNRADLPFLNTQDTNRDSIAETMQMQSNMQAAKTPSVSEILQQFEQQHQGFFNSPSRQTFKEYLIAKFDELDLQELAVMAKIVEAMENEAVENFKSQNSHQKAIEDANNQAKMRLNSFCFKPGQNVQDVGRNFSRQDVNNMSLEDFNKNEKQIMKQLRHEMLNRN